MVGGGIWVEEIPNALVVDLRDGERELGAVSSRLREGGWRGVRGRLRGERGVERGSTADDGLPAGGKGWGPAGGAWEAREGRLPKARWEQLPLTTIAARLLQQFIDHEAV